jgi:hypothetical protein
MANTEIAKQLHRERKQEIQKEARARRRELSTPPPAKIFQHEEREAIRQEEREIREQEERELREERE